MEQGSGAPWAVSSSLTPTPEVCGVSSYLPFFVSFVLFVVSWVFWPAGNALPVMNGGGNCCWGITLARWPNDFGDPRGGPGGGLLSNENLK